MCIGTLKNATATNAYASESKTQYSKLAQVWSVLLCSLTRLKAQPRFSEFIINMKCQVNKFKDL